MIPYLFLTVSNMSKKDSKGAKRSRRRVDRTRPYDLNNPPYAAKRP